MITKKIIKGKPYLYAEHSFRLPDGKIKKASKYIKNEKDAKSSDTLKYFQEKELEANLKYALKKYKSDHIFTQEKITKAETIRLQYRKIMKNLTKNQIRDIIDRFTANFTYESNALEGNSLTLKDVILILHENEVPKNHNLEEIYETRNSRIANELLFDNKIQITIPDIVALHKIIVKETAIPEGFKKIPNFLLMRNVKTTPPEQVQKEMKKLIEYYDAIKDKEHPIQVAADFHAKFERIHPFEDGNGRVGRILVNAILLKQGYPPIIIRKSMRTSYFSALAAHDNGYKDKLRRYFLEKFEKTFEKFFRIYVDYANKK
jgi:Fic family protein|tara:strand:- start:89 stop:1042 length:954 start_codon:yes stop_codon:yes gene_type:complete